MSEIEEFDRIATDIRQILTNQPSHPNALELYGLYKQATVGDVNIARPSLFDFRGKAKWDSWFAKKGLSKDQAKLEYVRTSKKVLSEILSQSMDLFSMAQTVKGVLPQVPIDVIRRDLIVTNNVDETITRLLDGTVYYDAEAEPVPLPVKKEEPAKKTTTSDKAATDKDASSTSAKESSQSNASQSDPVKTEKELKTISPMVYSTKASTFEKDPQLRMKSYQERKKQLLEVARAHYIEKHGLNQ